MRDWRQRIGWVPMPGFIAFAYERLGWTSDAQNCWLAVIDGGAHNTGIASKAERRLARRSSPNLALGALEPATAPQPMSAQKSFPSAGPQVAIRFGEPTPLTRGVEHICEGVPCSRTRPERVQVRMPRG